MNESDAIRLRHLLDAAQKASTLATGVSRDDLEKNKKLTRSLVKCIEIVGEGASRVSEQCQKENPGNPWDDIVGMRNRVIHAYFDIHLGILWNTI